MQTFLRYHLHQGELSILVPGHESASSLQPQLVRFDELSAQEQHVLTGSEAASSEDSSVAPSESSFRYAISNPFWTEIGREATYQSAHGETPPEKRLLRSIIPGASRPSGVVVLGVTKGQKICFIEELRYTTRRQTLCLPRGSCLAGESSIQAAVREFTEETGHGVLEDSRLEEVTQLESDSGILDAEVAVVLISAISAEPVVLIESSYEPRLRVRMLDGAQVAENLRQNKITDALTMAALMSAVSLGFLSLPL